MSSHGLSVSATLAKVRITAILTKLGLRDRVHAVIYTYQHGLVELPPIDRQPQ